VILAAAVIALAGCASLPTSGVEGVPPGAEDATIPVIDAHLHVNFANHADPTSGLPDTRAELAEEMRENHVVAAVALAHDGDPWEDLSDLGVIHCVGIGTEVDAAAVEAALASGRYRCIKIYLGYVHRFAVDPTYEPVYAAAARHRVPVVFHTGDTDSTKAKLKYADPLTVDEVAVDHPDVTFVIAHAGNPWIESAAEVAYKNPNVVLDGSAFLVGDLSGKSPGQVDEYLVRPLRWIFGYLEDPTKLMFGTDWPLVGIGPYLEAFKRAIPREHWRAVLHDNAARVFGITPAMERPR
jgi:predicted TIM-barrel fold metal-dependent hydrolase